MPFKYYLDIGRDALPCVCTVYHSIQSSKSILLSKLLFWCRLNVIWILVETHCHASLRYIIPFWAAKANRLVNYCFVPFKCYLDIDALPCVCTVYHSILSSESTSPCKLLFWCRLNIIWILVETHCHASLRYIIQFRAAKAYCLVNYCFDAVYNIICILAETHNCASVRYIILFWVVKAHHLVSNCFNAVQMLLAYWQRRIVMRIYKVYRWYDLQIITIIVYTNSPDRSNQSIGAACVI